MTLFQDPQRILIGKCIEISRHFCLDCTCKSTRILEFCWEQNVRSSSGSMEWEYRHSVLQEGFLLRHKEAMVSGTKWFWSHEILTLDPGGLLLSCQRAGKFFSPLPSDDLLTVSSEWRCPVLPHLPVVPGIINSIPGNYIQSMWMEAIELELLPHTFSVSHHISWHPSIPGHPVR